MRNKEIKERKKQEERKERERKSRAEESKRQKEKGRQGRTEDGTSNRAKEERQEEESPAMEFLLDSEDEGGIGAFQIEVDTEDDRVAFLTTKGLVDTVECGLAVAPTSHVVGAAFRAGDGALGVLYGAGALRVALRGLGQRFAAPRGEPLTIFVTNFGEFLTNLTGISF